VIRFEPDHDLGLCRRLLGAFRALLCRSWAREAVVWILRGESVLPLVAGRSPRWPSEAPNRTRVAPDVQMARRYLAWWSEIPLGQTLALVYGEICSVIVFAKKTCEEPNVCEITIAQQFSISKIFRIPLAAYSLL
jgi:hypothetical protein